MSGSPDGSEVIDLRSDTVTRPSRNMREAMAQAEVGDDVFGDDPTVLRLEDKAAEITGKEASLFVPSGCMANMIGVMAQAPAGSEIIVADNSHIHCAEAGAYGRLAQVNKWPLRVDRWGRMNVDEVIGSIHIGHGHPGGNPHLATTTLVCLENTNNFSGGTVQSPEDLREIVNAARNKAPWIRIHLDGARIFNASICLNLPVRAFAEVADSVSFCLSKGLGAPVGSMICGTQEMIGHARALRKMLGGGMRQAGLLAACGLMALTEAHIAQLAVDHVNARRLGEGLAELPGIAIDLEVLQTNILFFTCASRKGDASWLVEALGKQGIRCLTLGHRVRMVLHRDVNREQVDRVLKVADGVLR